MKLLIICMTILTSTAQAFITSPTVACRDAVVDARFALRDPIEPHSFASMERKNFSMSAEKFNALSTEKQKEYYNKMTTMNTIVNITLSYLDSVIEFFEENEEYSQSMSSYVMELKGHFEALANCK